MLRVRSVLAGCLAAVLMFATGGCTEDAKGDKNTGPVDKVAYLTAFGMTGREGYVIVADKKGFFKKRNIEVSIQAGNGAGDNMTKLASGVAQFSANDISAVMSLQGNGKLKAPVRAVAAIQQLTLNAIIVMASSGITQPKQLEGKKIASPANSAPQLLFPAFAALSSNSNEPASRLDPSKVTFINLAAPAVQPALVAGQVDGIGQFTVSAGTVSKVAGGKPVNVLAYSDYVRDLYGNGLFTTNKLIDENPDLVKRFRDALLEGLAYALEHPEEAGKLINAKEPAVNAEGAQSELELMKPYAMSSGRVGILDESRVIRAIAILQGTGVVQPGLTADEMVAFSLAPKG